jgi:hypothetical protein
MGNWMEKILSDNIENKALYEMIKESGFRVVKFSLSGHLIVRDKLPCSKILLK